MQVTLNKYFQNFAYNLALRRGFESISNVFLVQRRIDQEHKNVIQMNYDYDVKVKPEHTINKGLKAGSGVC